MPVYRFDLDTALSAWRRALDHNPAFDADDLDELEGHVREQVADRVAEGATPEAAWGEAMREMGDVPTAEAEYRKVYWGKLRRRRLLARELLWRLSMLKNYATVGLRNARRQPGYTFINVAGLAVGMACCLLIFMLVRHEWSFDRFHEHADRLYRTSFRYTDLEGETQYQNMMRPEFTPQLVDAFPAIEHATRYVMASQDLQVGNEFFRQQLVEVDAPFFEMFSFPLLAGDPATVLDDRSKMVVTAPLAEALFGVEPGRYADALGETVTITRNEVAYTFTISGVAATPPPNSSLTFEALISFENYDDIYLGGNNWGGRTSTYVLLAPDQDPAAFEASLQPFAATAFAEYVDALRSNERLAPDDDTYTLDLQPLTAMHQSPDVWISYETAAHDPLYSYILAGIALLVLLIACINFMTLAIGRSAGRAREVGLRKVLGAQRGQLMHQFWGEALLLTGASLGFGVGLTLLALPFYNTLIEKDLSLATFAPVEIGAFLLLLLIVVGLVAGGYPALLLSRFQPAQVLKGGAVRTPGRRLFTRGLVVLQYTISIGLIIGTLVMAQQLDYLLNRDLGYDDELVMAVHTHQLSSAEAPRTIGHFRNVLLPYGRIEGIARTGSPFTRQSDRNSWTDADGVTRSAYNIGVDEAYLDVMGMELAAGRNFSTDFPSDSTQSILVNEALVREFEIEDPVGKKLSNWLSWIYEDSPTIIGVVRDFNYRSLKEEVQPVVLNMHPQYYNFMNAILVKIRPDDVRGTIDLVERTWNETLPGKPFTYSFLDEDLAGMYQTEQRWSRIVSYASLIAIFIACLGLFGLATFTAQRRTKEIGIRKVLGASVGSLVGLLSKDFALLVLVAFTLAAPLAYFAMRRWLESFAYRIDLPIWAFGAAGLATLAIALLTVSYRSLRTALADPVETLRHE